MMLRKTLVLCAIPLLMTVAMAAADATVDVYVNDAQLRLDPPARNHDGETYVPLRAVVEVVGGEVTWDAASRAATVTIGADVFSFDAADGLFVDGRMLVPLRALHHSPGITIAWNADKQRVQVTLPGRPLAGRVMAILVEEGFHDQELDVPRQQVEAAGARTVLVGSEAGAVYEDYRGQQFIVTADMAARDASAEQFDALLIPGGQAPAIMRENEEMLRLVREFDAAKKPIAAICHGPWVLVSAGVVEGREMTCVSGIADDLREAGAEYRDEAVVVDGHLITSRVPRDLEAFSTAIIEALSAPQG
ncbi:MAG: DJ-1/PfpI/YhbO family deglycase/protease [Armatimonadota bacterium]|jgi:protease I